MRRQRMLKNMFKRATIHQRKKKRLQISSKSRLRKLQKRSLQR
jgi:hypothetical protein